MIRSVLAGPVPLLASVALALGACGDPSGPPAVATVEIVPGGATLTALGDTIRLTATAKDADGDVIGGKPFSWSTSDVAVVAVDPVTGLATANSNGAATITAMSDGVSGSASLTVEQAVSTIVVLPNSSTLVSLGDTVQLSASGEDSRGNPVGGTPFEWLSSDTMIVRVDVAGRATAVAHGSVTATATTGGVAGNAVVTVSQVVDSVAVTPVTATLSPGETLQLGALPVDARGNEVVGRTIIWSSADALVAAVTTEGLVTAMGARLGYALISAASDGRSGSASMSVVVDFSSLTAALSHTCGLTPDEAVYCWGGNDFSQLGNGSPYSTPELVPVALAGGLGFATISAWNWHSCGVAPGGGAHCWGWNADGQLGDGTKTNRSLPVAAVADSLFASIAVGGLHTCGLTLSGRPVCWGRNDEGQLGDGSNTDSLEPVGVAGGLDLQVIRPGYVHTCALTTGNDTYCWGDNAEGQLGNGSTVPETAPVAVSGGLSFVSITSGNRHSCGLTAAGTAYCWGSNSDGQLGDASTADRSSPVAVTGGQSFVHLAAGGRHTCALTGGGSAFCWGRNLSGEVGDGTTVMRTTPAAVAGGFAFASLTSGGAHSCGITTSGAAYCWGDNGYGKLGDGTSTRRLVPVLVLGSYE